MHCPRGHWFHAEVIHFKTFLPAYSLGMGFAQKSCVYDISNFAAHVGYSLCMPPLKTLVMKHRQPFTRFTLYLMVVLRHSTL